MDFRLVVRVLCTIGTSFHASDTAGAGNAVVGGDQDTATVTYPWIKLLGKLNSGGIFMQTLQQGEAALLPTNVIFLNIECMAYYPVEWALKGFTPLSVNAVRASLFTIHIMNTTLSQLNLTDSRFVQNLWQTSTFKFSSDIWFHLVWFPFGQDLGSHAIARNQTKKVCREATTDPQGGRRLSTRLDVSAEADGSGMLRFEATNVPLAAKFEDADTLVAGVGPTSGGCRVRAVFQKEPSLIC